MQAFILDAELGRGAAGGVEQVGGGWGWGGGVDRWWVCRWWRREGGAGEGKAVRTLQGQN